jgi:hypothetical protein
VSGTTNFSQYVDRKKSGEVLQKKYIHVVRKVLLCQWLMAPSTSDTWPPPLLIAELLKATVGLEDADVVNSGSSAAFGVNEEVVREIELLLEPSRLEGLRHVGPRRPVLDTWIIQRQSALKVLLQKHPRGEPANDVDVARRAWDSLLVPLARSASGF